MEERSREQNVFIQYYFQQVYQKIEPNDKIAFELLEEIERQSKNTD